MQRRARGGTAADLLVADTLTVSVSLSAFAAVES